ncbi:MAG: hypothetical protein AMJ90_07455 [candidate division Zixibacteria bacterium SM23_73_2]|nr:MAG: hypothetical protein AMJ90_07455 [candidate division Zixibacteria bacterium SM23_73_2]
MVLKIRTYGDPVLRERCREVEKIDGRIKKLVSDMLETLKNVGGIGLSANQVGESKRLFVVDMSRLTLEEIPLVVINPRIIEKKGKQTSEEGCLSVPGIWADVTRPQKLKIKGIDLNEKEIEVEGQGILAKVFSHEMDHLDGLFFVDRLRSIDKRLLSKKLKLIANKKS